MSFIWIQTQKAAVASRRASNLATHLPKLDTHLPNLAPHLSKEKLVHQKPARWRWNGKASQMEASNISGAAHLVQQNMNTTFAYLGHALYGPVFYYSLLLNFCDFNSTEIFLCGPEGLRGRKLRGPLLLCILSAYMYSYA